MCRECALVCDGAGCRFANDRVCSVVLGVSSLQKFVTRHGLGARGVPRLKELISQRMRAYAQRAQGER